MCFVRGLANVVAARVLASSIFVDLNASPSNLNLGSQTIRPHAKTCWTLSLSRSYQGGIKPSSARVCRYKIVRRLPPFVPPDNDTDCLLPRALYDLNEYPSKTQARKACQFGKVVVFPRCGAADLALGGRNEIENKIENSQEIFNVINGSPGAVFVGNRNTTIYRGDVIAILERLPNEFYPESSTGYLFPPRHLPWTVYEDNELAVVVKPENLTTIAQKRKDLQSTLPFILRPPSPISLTPKRKALFLPRPVHRLDRRTSGLVLVAKTELALSTLSQFFADRSVEKTYTALVFGRRTQSFPGCTGEKPWEWNTIDHPIDGKRALTMWRVLKHSPASFGSISLLELRPLTGRYHQIRRHLAYCLDRPIIGDTKYDRGCEIALSLRTSGMFLCSHVLKFPYPGDAWDPTYAEYTWNKTGHVNWSTSKGVTSLSAAIPLPTKFLETYDKLASSLE
mmetsp:Transcript_10003/g.29599  ORF Transcript_10003/g.29599 Transcript_10003/m.29599 type:complete len:452 (-) Transcript_10003:1898-3253(-)